MTSKTLYRKLVDSHSVVPLDEQNVLLFCDLHLMNEYTIPQAFAGLDEQERGVPMPGQNVAVVSHVIPSEPVKLRVIHESAPALQASNLKRNCDRHGIPLFDTNDALQGIEHVIAPEHGMIRPGMVVICGDSHTTTYGALGALGFGIGTSEVEHVLATQNMTVEAGARGALIAPDQQAIDYVLQRAPDITGAWRDQALAHWATLHSDVVAAFEVEHQFDGSNLAPYVTWGTSPDQVIAIDGRVPDPLQSAEGPQRRSTEQALRYTGLEAGAAIEGTPVQHVFIGSCTNARIEDLRAAADVVRGRAVATGVRAMVVPGSGAVKAQAEAEGLDRLFVDAGFEWRQPGCSMCLAMNGDILTAGTRCASTTNRNFEGRQGRGAITHLMSPAMAAAAAGTGRITDVRKLESTRV